MDGGQHAEDPIDAGWRISPPTASTYRSAIRRQAWLVIACLIASAVAGLAVIVLSNPLYTARVSLYLEPEPSVEIRSEQTLEMDLETHVELIRSDETVATVIRAQGLDQDPAFLPPTSRLRQLVSDIRVWLGGAPDRGADGPPDRLLDMIRYLRDGLDVSRIGNTRVIEIRYTSGSPDFSVAIADNFAQAYLIGVSARDDGATERRVERLEARADRMRQQAVAADARIHALLDDSGPFAANPQELEQHTAALRDRMSALEAEIAVLSAKRSRIADQSENGEFAVVAAGTDESRRLLDDLALAQARAEEIGGRTNAGENVLETVEATVDSIRQSLDQELRLAIKAVELQRDFATAERDNIIDQMSRLRDYIGGGLRSDLEAARRDANFYEGMYQDYLTRLENLYRQPQARPDLRIVSGALAPRTPSSPNYKVVLAVFLTLGLFLGIGLALMREWSRHDQDEVV